MKLNVPLIKQRNSLGCGPTSLSMVLKFFGEDYSEAQIIKSTGTVSNKKLKKEGTFIIDNALFAQELGFKVFCYSYNMELLRPNFIALSAEKLKKGIKVMQKSEKEKIHRRIFNSYLELIDSGAKFKIMMPRLKDIEYFLKQKLPVIIVVNRKIFFEKPDAALWGGHFIVITGYDKGNFYYNDPADAKAKKVSRDKLFFALSNNVLTSTAYLLVIKPEQRGRKK